jgi:hypothetical protein
LALSKEQRLTAKVSEMTPTKIVLTFLRGATKHSDQDIALVVYAPETERGYTVIERAPHVTGKSIPSMRKTATKYAKRWNIPFEDKIA